MKFLYFIMLLAALSNVVCSNAQEIKDSTKNLKQLEEVVISGSKFAEKKRNIVQRIDVINLSSIAKNNAQNMGDLLMSTGNIFVQKSQQGGSSPVIRGFEASRVLLIVDGVRMNNLIYRSGHLQNVITVDQNMLERVEVLYGPASTLYGSDALGGAVHMISKKPTLSTENKKTFIQTNAFARYASSNNEQTMHADINVGGNHFASLSSFTYSNFGDVRIGSHDKKGFENFGTRPFYIQPYTADNPYDTILKNSNDRIQKFTGYSQVDFTQKFIFQQNERVQHLFNFQVSNSSDVPRYDRLQDIKNGALRYASWYYGPQKRKLLSYQLSVKTKAGMFDEYRATASYQDIEESRITREYKRYDRFDKRVEHVKVGGLIVDAIKKFEHDEITTGIDIQLNDLVSTATRTNLITNAVTPLDTRYPNGKNTMNSAAVFIQHIHKFNDNRWVLNDGIRAQLVSLESTITDNSFFSLPVTEVHQKNSTITGNIGIAYHPTNKTSFKFGYARGFRVPNVDDLSKVFESSTAAKQVVIPNTTIQPEYTNGIDLTFMKRIASIIELEGSVFYTQFTNAIVKAPFQLNGQDSIVYNGIKSQVMANQNVNKASIVGASLMLNVKLNEHLKFNGTFNTIKGDFKLKKGTIASVYQLQSNNTYALVKTSVDSKPLDHIPPTYGRLALAYEKNKIFSEFYLIYNGWKKLDRYNPDGEDNAQYATSEGTPSWKTLNWRMGYDVNVKIKIQAAVENILDVNYRFFASGFSAPGRNLVLSLRTSL